MDSLKDRYQLKAEELSLSIYGKSFYDLSENLQIEVYNLAMKQVFETIVGDR